MTALRARILSLAAGPIFSRRVYPALAAEGWPPGAVDRERRRMVRDGVLRITGRAGGTTWKRQPSEAVPADGAHEAARGRG